MGLPPLLLDARNKRIEAMARYQMATTAYTQQTGR